MFVSYYHPDEQLRLYEIEITEQELSEILAEHLGASKVFLDKAEVIDLLKGVDEPERFLKL